MNIDPHIKQQYEKLKPYDIKTSTKKDILESGYKLGKVLGSGASGTVYDATKILAGKVYAIKKVYKSKFFASEHIPALHAYKLGLAPQIVEIFNIGTDVYFVYEKVYGYTLKEYMEKFSFINKYLYEKLNKLLNTLHKNHITHGDTQPQNIMITVPECAIKFNETLEKKDKNSLINILESKGVIIKDENNIEDIYRDIIFLLANDKMLLTPLFIDFDMAQIHQNEIDEKFIEEDINLLFHNEYDKIIVK